MDEHWFFFFLLLQKNDAWSHLYVESKKAESMEAESRRVVIRVGELGEMGRCWSKGTKLAVVLNE